VNFTDIVEEDLYSSLDCYLWDRQTASNFDILAFGEKFVDMNVACDIFFGFCKNILG
jgi:hypothetical protein